MLTPPINVNGYQIREGIKRWILQRDTAANAFQDSLYAFGDEEKDSPGKVMAGLEEAERNIARLEELQQRYNQHVSCKVQGETISLALCVKLVGGAGRREKMWRESAAPKKDRHSFRDELVRARDTSKEYSTRTLSVRECADRARSAARTASALRNAIARGNSTEVEITRLGILDAEEYKSLFE